MDAREVGWVCVCESEREGRVRVGLWCGFVRMVALEVVRMCVGMSLGIIVHISGCECGCEEVV